MSTPHEAPGHQKRRLRHAMRATRNALASELRAEYSRRIVAEVLRLFDSLSLLDAGKKIAIFLATPGEPNVDELVPLLKARGAGVLAPHFEDALLPFHEIGVDCGNIQETTFGTVRVRAPRADAENRAVAAREVDVVLLPGLAFDERGNRLGQGGGWYDRVLAQAPEALKIGVGFDFQIVDDLPREAHDEVMNFVVTEKRVLKF